MRHALCSLTIKRQKKTLWLERGGKKGHFNMETVIKVISLILGVLGFIISLINLAYSLYTRKVKLTFSASNFRVAEFSDTTKLACVYFTIENHAQLPISITRIRIKGKDNKYYDAKKEPYQVYQEIKRRGEIINDKITVYSEKLPINLPSLAAFAGYLVFPIPQDALQGNETNLTFEICTNRGKSFEKIFELSPEYQVLVSQ